MLREVQDEYIGDSGIQYILYVKQSHGSQADAVLFGQNNSAWTALCEKKAVIGKNGIGKQCEGDGKTPSGVLHIVGAFGFKPNPGTSLDYIRITDEHLACDEDCSFYNRIVRTSEPDHECGGERMAEYTPQYNYGLITDFNKECVYPLGSNIFIHCRGERDYTAGCIAFEEEFMISLLKFSSDGMLVMIES